MKQKPRNRTACAPILRKGGPHTTTRKAERRRDKVALGRAVRESPETSKLDTIMGMFRSGAVITVDNSPLLTSVETSKVTGSPDNQVVRLIWTDGEGLNWQTILTEEGISGGYWDAKGQFCCDDHEGELAVITFYKLDKVVPPGVMPEMVVAHDR